MLKALREERLEALAQAECEREERLERERRRCKLLGDEAVRCNRLCKRRVRGSESIDCRPRRGTAPPRTPPTPPLERRQMLKVQLGPRGVSREHKVLVEASDHVKHLGAEEPPAGARETREGRAAELGGLRLECLECPLGAAELEGGGVGWGGVRGGRGG